jgi:Rrf2 family transcriptional regulator, iron-sulfur cluster assembly transcription factor
MKLGRESSYAIDGLLALAKKRPVGKVMLLRDVAKAAAISESFLAKIFQRLTRAAILNSSRGAVRGYALARRPKQITIKDIIVAVEGPDVFQRCLFWSNRCADASPCSMHFRWKKVRERLIGELERITLADL